MVKPVLLIRGDDNAGDAQALSRLGIASLVDPYLEITMASDPTSGRELLKKLEGVASPLWLIATSVNALKFWAQIVGEEQLRAVIAARVDMQFAAVGLATADALRAFGASQVILPSDATGKALAEELIGAFPVGHAIVPGGNLAMQTLPSILLSAGWEVSTAVVYTTSPVAKEPDSARLVRQKEVSAILLRSPSAVRALTHFLPNPGVPLVCAGTTTAQALEAQGLKADALSPKPSADVVASTIYSLLCQERISRKKR